MDILGLLLIIVFVIRTIRNTIYHIFWWQLKEYRLDRMLVHLKETYQGRRWCFGYFSTIKWILLGGYLLGKTSPFWLKDITKLPAFAKATAGGRYYDITIFFFWGVFFIYLVEAVFNLKELKGGWKVPQARPKTVILLLAALSVKIGVISLISRIGPISLIVLDKLLGPIVAGLVLGVNIPFEIYKKWLIKKAKEKMREVTPLRSLSFAGQRGLRVVGVTGSYGKTTTKEFITQILSKKFRVLKTAGSQNTDIGVAELILRSNLENYDIVVCEMAAYHRGEIRKICEIVKPHLKVAVVTGINEQHQSLFGSLEKTMKAKFELVEALPKDGLAIFNGENKYCRKMVEWARRRGLKVRVVREMGEMKGVKSDITTRLPARQVLGYYDIEERKEGLNFFRENLALALAIAREFGMSKEEIRRVVKELKLPSKTMNVIKKGRLTLIDDTFNANPDGVLAALKFLQDYKTNETNKTYKTLVLQPLIELGKYADCVHEKIGKKAVQVCDEIILTNRNFYQAFMKGAKRAKRDKRVRVAERLPEIKKGVILFEGKEAEKYLKTLS